MAGPDHTAPDRVVILNDFSSVQGGAGYLANALAGGLADRGVPVTFVSGDAGGGAAHSGVEPLALGGLALLEGGAARAAMRGLYNRAAASAIRRWIAHHDTPRTIYHLHNWSNILSPSVFDVLAPLARRCVIHAHDFSLACPNGSYLDFPQARVCTRTPLSPGCLATSCDKRNYSHKLWRVARQRLLFARLRPHLADATFVMIHPAMRPWLSRAFQPSRMLAIRNPVTPFAPMAQAPERQSRLVHIGQIQRLKGVHDLAEAGRRLNVVVDFFGSGEDLADLRARYPEHVWHGHTDRATLGQHLQTARAMVIATQSPEPFCLAAFESAAAGVPLVVSDAILAATELVNAGVAVPFAAGDVGALTAVLARVLADDALVARLAGAARKTEASGLTEWVAAHDPLYSGVLARAGADQSKDQTLVHT